MAKITEYMTVLHKKLVEERKVADSTATQYIKTLYKLNNSTPFKNLAFLKNKDAIESKLKDYAESTQKSLMSNIVSALSLYKDASSYKKIYAYWFNRMMERVKSDQEKPDDHQKSLKQEDNWLSWEVVKSHQDALKKEVQEFENKGEITSKEWDSLLNYMLLSLYVEMPPRRNQDYQFLKVSRKNPLDEEFNYIVLDDGNFVFNKYKTKKTHGKLTFPIPPTLQPILRTYLHFHPLFLTKGKNAGKPVHFLVDFEGNPFGSVNAITRLLNKIFGKRVGSTMLRHIYLSDKYDVNEMENDAQKMSHSADVQRNYMKKVQKVQIPTYNDEEDEE
jgi:integrase